MHLGLFFFETLREIVDEQHSREAVALHDTNSAFESISIFLTNFNLNFRAVS